jgi:hypothetical protein
MMTDCAVTEWAISAASLRPLLERVTVARDELTTVSANVGQGAEAIKFGLEDKLRMIERLRDAKEPHGRDLGHGNNNPTSPGNFVATGS